jgi:hypothetical protein
MRERKKRKKLLNREILEVISLNATLSVYSQRTASNDNCGEM